MLLIIMPSPQDGSSIPNVEVPNDIPSQSPLADALVGSCHVMDIRLFDVASCEAPHDVAPMQRFPRASIDVPLNNVISVDGSMISFAPGDMMMSPVTV